MGVQLIVSDGRCPVPGCTIKCTHRHTGEEIAGPKPRPNCSPQPKECDPFHIMYWDESCKEYVCKKCGHRAPDDEQSAMTRAVAKNTDAMMMGMCTSDHGVLPPKPCSHTWVTWDPIEAWWSCRLCARVIPRDVLDNMKTRVLTGLPERSPIETAYGRSSIDTPSLLRAFTNRQLGEQYDPPKAIYRLAPRVSRRRRALGRIMLAWTLAAWVLWIVFHFGVK